ncbi:MAG: choice-of-anchor D domain-containing protein, partial [Planctomycetes bacterium]|nr:choice-of-anchor D domain-containing protein [Planctomycetota bacterium]
MRNANLSRLWIAGLVLLGGAIFLWPPRAQTKNATARVQEAPVESLRVDVEEEKPAELAFGHPPALQRDYDGRWHGEACGLRRVFSREGIALSSQTHNLNLALKDVRIGERSILAPSVQGPVVERDRVVYRRAEIVEQYLVESNGIEQIFVLDKSLEPLRSGGPLTIAVSLGTPLRAVHVPTSSGDTIDFRDAGDRSILRYGSAIAIDAADRRWPLRYVLHDGELAMVLDADALALAQFPLTIDPTIGLSTTTLSFIAPSGGPSPSPQAFYVSNTGTGTLRWTGTDDATWLSVSPRKGRSRTGQSRKVRASVDTTGLADGVYSATITITDNTATNSPQTISVSLLVTSSAVIGLSPASLTFNAPVGGPNPAFQNVTVSNLGAGTLSYTAGATAPWLSLNPAAGSLVAGASSNMSVAVDVTSLAAGTYSDTITVTDPAALNSPQTVTVTLNVYDAPTIALAPASLSFSGPEGGPSPPPQSMTVQNVGTGILNWSAVDDAAWLSVSPISGSLSAGSSATLNVIVDTTGLVAGAYAATITVSDPGAINSPQIVSVALSVETLPTIEVAPANLTFNAPVGGPNPSPKTFTVANIGGGTLSWSGTDDAAWLSLSPTSGDLVGGASAPVTASVDVTGLAAGTYTANITISDPGATNSPELLFVTLNVNALPLIALSPAGLTFNAPAGGPNPASQTVTVTNAGGGTLSWTASDNATWLSLSPGSGSLSGGASASMTATVDVAGLPAGTYTATITVSDPGATNTPQMVFVTLNVSALPTIGLSPGTMTFTAPVGGPNPASQPLTVRNTGGGTLSWTAADSATWLSVSPAGGSLAAGASSSSNVAVDVTGLSAGTYNATITVSDPGATNTPQTVFVTLTVTSSPVIALNPGSLTFSAPVGGPNPASQTVTVTNSGGGTLSWSAVDSATWLSLAPASGSLGAGASSSMSASVDVTGLSAGTYTATITVSDGGAANSPQTVFVTLNVMGAPTIGLSPASLTFTAMEGGANPASQTATVTNTGGGTLSWSGSDDAAWMTLSPLSGSLASAASELMTVSVDITGLPAGTYNGTITVSDPGATNSPQTVAVTLNVNAPPTIGRSPASLTFTAMEGGANPASQDVTISNTGGTTLSWSAVDDAAWMT